MDKMFAELDALNDPDVSEMLGGILVVNGWTFCKCGQENCHECLMDHRFTNNEENGIDDNGKYRDSLVVVTKKVDKFKWACQRHECVDCQDCFNFKEIIRKGEIKNKIHGAKIENETIFDQSSIKLCQLLENMGIDTSKTTQNNLKDLNKKILLALRRAERLDTMFPSSIDPTTLSEWNKITDGSIQNAFNIVNLNEAYENFQKFIHTGKREANDVKINLIKSCREFDVASFIEIIQDEKQQSAICLKFLSVKKTVDGLPLILLLYSHELKIRVELMSEHMAWVQHQLKKQKLFMSVNSTLDEQRLLLNCLELNATKLKHGINVKREKFENKMKLSFIIPVRPLNIVDIENILHNQQCVVCSKSTTNTCGKCKAMAYCSRDCQTKDWSEHKKTCKKFEDLSKEKKILKHHADFIDNSSVLSQLTLNDDINKQDKFW
ncbi:unnamed protein product [Didymodactylos carnosus]|uniref:MYND-type domain-containing protein n=1 Tax=Didymodactylos carnosus TaxID=1234261 RepID=A0A8S2EQC7_9BILA|nr:unnamed protein product [Didymodactylos carnosus]CAF4019343.1 unnamed protein product [Didymodactylos carnosus]